MNLSEMRNEFYEAVGQDASIAVDTIDQTRANRLLNRAAEYVARIIRRNRQSELTKTGTVSVVSGTREYSLPTDFLDLHFAEKSTTGTDRPVEIPVDTAMKRGESDLESNRAYLRANKLGFYAIPQSAYTVTLHYAPSITAMSLGTHDLSDSNFQDPPIRAEFHPAIVARAAYRLVKQERGGDADLFFQDWLDERQEMVRTVRRRGGGKRYINVTSRVQPVNRRSF